MARRNETVWCGIFDDLLPGGVAIGAVKLNGAPIMVYQVRAQPRQSWVGVIGSRRADYMWMADSAEAVKFAVENWCKTKVIDWREGYWDGDTWQPKTSRPAFNGTAKEPFVIPLPAAGKGGKHGR